MPCHAVYQYDPWENTSTTRGDGIMELDDVFLAGPTARKALRNARRKNHLVLVANQQLPRHLDRGSVSDVIPNLATFGLDSPNEGIVGLWFRDQGSRRPQDGVSCHVLSPSMPVDGFVTIQAVDHHGVPEEGMRIRCESPNLSVLTYAQELHAHTKASSLTPEDVIVLLASYVMELTGTYAKCPEDPRHGQDAFKLKAVTTRKSLLAFLDRMHRYPCVTIARKAAEFAVEGAASRMETLTSLITSLPPRFGGASLGRAELNRALELGQRDLWLIKHRSLKPDLFWRDYRLIVEYDGNDFHSAPKQKREDKYRIQDYQTLGYTVIPISYEDVATVGALDRLLLRLVTVIGRTRGNQYVRNKRRFLRDAAQLRKRDHLLRLLLSC